MADDIVAVARKFRSQAKSRGSRARGVLANRYGAVAKGVRADAVKLEREVLALRKTGAVPTPELVASLRTAQALRDRTQYRLVLAADSALDIVTRETTREVTAAMKDARQLVALRRAGQTLADKVEETAVLNLVGTTDKGPLRELLVKRAGRDADKVSRVLIDGLVRERTVASMADDITGLLRHGSHADALRIVKTETHRVRREAARVVYGRTPGVKGWVWVCSLSPTSCGLCWAQHGQVFTSSQPMATHPNCSCEVAPWYGEDIDTGVDLFDALSASEQDTAIGPAAARAYRAGEIGLGDLVATGRSAQWGATGHQASLSSVLGGRASDFYRA